MNTKLKAILGSFLPGSVLLFCVTMFAAPTAKAQVFSCSADTIYSLDYNVGLSTAGISAVNTSTGGSTPFGTAIPKPAGSSYTTFNGMGIDVGGSRVFVAHSTGSTHGAVTMRDMVAQTQVVSPIPANASAAGAMLGGSVNPVDGWFYYGGPVNSGNRANPEWALFAYPPGGTPFRVGRITNVIGNQGDFVFDSVGNLYLVTGNTSNPDGAGPPYNANQFRIYRVDAPVPTSSGNVAMPATAITPGFGAAGENYGGIAFSNGELIVQVGNSGANSQYRRYNPATGAYLGGFTSVSGQDLASCQNPNTIRLRKALPNGRVVLSDQFTLNIAQGANVQATTTTTGSTTAPTEVATLNLAATGVTYSLSETASGTTVLGNYTAAWACTNMRTGGQAPSGNGRSFNITVAAGDDLTCTFSNAHTPLPVFACDATLYLVQGGRLYTVDRSSNPFTYPTLGASGATLNAMGYNPADDYLYALNRVNSDDGRRLYRIGAGGVRQDLGLVSGLPSPSGAPYDVGAFTDEMDNILYVMVASGSNQMHRIDVTTMTATPITLSRSVMIADFDFADGLLYSVESASGQLISIDPVTGAVTNIGSAQGSVGTLGSIYADADGIYAITNSVAGGFYKFDRTTGQRTLISSAPAAASSDGASCPTAPPLTFNADLAITKDDGSTNYTPGTDVEYTIVVSNKGPFGAQDARVQDALPAGITTATWTCTAANGAVCRTASGSGAIDARVDLPFNTGGAAAATATFTLTMSVPADYTGALTNVVTVTPGDGTTDPDLSNNEDEDTNQPAAADLWVTKTNTPASGPSDQAGDEVLAGTETTYEIVIGNAADSVDVANAALGDTPSAGLVNCVLATPACEIVSGAATCPAVGGGSGELSMANLASGNVLIPSLPAGSSVKVRMTCMVE